MPQPPGRSSSDASGPRFAAAVGSKAGPRSRSSIMKASAACSRATWNCRRASHWKAWLTMLLPHSSKASVRPKRSRSPTPCWRPRACSVSTARMTSSGVAWRCRVICIQSRRQTAAGRTIGHGAQPAPPLLLDRGEGRGEESKEGRVPQERQRLSPPHPGPLPVEGRGSRVMRARTKEGRRPRLGLSNGGRGSQMLRVQPRRQPCAFRGSQAPQFAMLSRYWLSRWARCRATR